MGEGLTSDGGGVSFAIPIGGKEMRFGGGTGKYDGFVAESRWLLFSLWRSPVERAGWGGGGKKRQAEGSEETGRFEQPLWGAEGAGKQLHFLAV